MPNSVSGSSTEHICSEIKKIEMNPQDDSPGPAINNLPAMRGSQGGDHFEGMTKKK
jgi:hypothetical protein